jgi:phosphonoacetaldehyde hydrolase
VDYRAGVSGNELGLNQSEAEALPPEARATRRREIAARMLHMGAHYVADGIWDAAQAVNEIQAPLAQGERPQVHHSSYPLLFLFG